MNTMVDNIKAFLEKLSRKRGVQVFLGAAFLLLIISGILRAVTPQPPPAATVITNDQTFSPQISFTDITLTLPKRLTVYVNNENKENKIDEVVNQFTKKLNLTKKSQLDIWSSDDFTISLQKNDNRDIVLAFYTEDGLPPRPNVPENRPKALENIKSLLGQLGIQDKYEISEPEYVVMENHIVPAISKEYANALYFKVNVLLDGIPLISGDTTSSPVEFWTDLSGNIRKASFYPTGENFQKVQEYSSLSPKTIEQQVLAQQVTYIKVRSKIIFEGATNNLQEATFSTANLEYRRNEQNGYILPYVRFTGTGKDKAGETFDVEAITPAIRVE